MRAKNLDNVMRPEIRRLWNLLFPPGRLNRAETGAYLGFSEDAVSELARGRMLTALGNPKPGDPLWFAWVEVDQKRLDQRWLDKATKIIREKIKIKNGKRSKAKGGAVNE